MRIYESQPSGTITGLRELRRNAPEPERRLLRGLREAFPDLKWRHQAPVGPFKADIMCFAERLVVEVDGDTHVDRERQDAARTRFMEHRGYHVVRFTNADVMGNPDGVIAAISLSLREREGAAQRREGEGDDTGQRRLSPSPSHAAARRGPLPLPMGDER